MGRLGYEHRCGFWIDDEIISLYKEALDNTQFKCFLFEVRTNFILRTRPGDNDDDIIMDSERLVATVAVEGKNWHYLLVQTEYRLREYWMCDDMIENLIYQAFNFAKHIAVDVVEGDIVPVVVGVDVCTVRLEGEPLDDAIDRSIRPDWLIPLYLWPHTPIVAKEILKMGSCFLEYLHFSLRKIRVEDVDEGLALMETCPICLRAPTVSAQISLLAPCNHAFHNHCVVQWLLKSKSCPLCRSEIVIGRHF